MEYGEEGVELHHPEGLNIEHEYSFEDSQLPRKSKLSIIKEKIGKLKCSCSCCSCSNRQKCNKDLIPSKKCIKITLIITGAVIAFLLVTLLLISISFGTGFAIGWEIGQHEDVEYNFYQGYPYVHHSPKDPKLNRNDPIESVMMQTNEYQFKLDVKRFAKDRMTGVRQLLILVEQVLNVTINEKNIEESAFTETQYASGDCGIKYSELRVRNYVGGKNDRTSESDINKNADPHSSMANAMKFNLVPADQYLDTCEMKIEQDLHPCWYKFNKKTKVKGLPSNFGFKTCGDVRALYPHSFPGANPHSSITAKSTSHYWEYKYHSHMQDGQTKFKLSFNLKYKTLDDAIKGNGTPITGSSEFSIRMYSLNDGLGDWDYQLLAEMGENYQYLLDTYGSQDYPC